MRRPTEPREKGRARSVNGEKCWLFNASPVRHAEKAIYLIHLKSQIHSLTRAEWRTMGHLCYKAVRHQATATGNLVPSIFSLFNSLLSPFARPRVWSERERSKRCCLLCCRERAQGWLHLHGSLPPSRDIEWPIEWRTQSSHYGVPCPLPNFNCRLCPSLSFTQNFSGDLLFPLWPLQ